MKKNSKKIWDFMQDTQEGSGNIRQIFNALPEPQRRFVATAWIARLGRDNPSGTTDAFTDFTLNNFTKNWNKISNSAKDMIFGGADDTALGQYRKNLDILANEFAKFGKTISPHVEQIKGKTPSPSAFLLAYAPFVTGFGVGALGQQVYASYHSGEALGTDRNYGELGMWGAVGGVISGKVSAMTAKKFITDPALAKWLVNEAPNLSKPSQIAQSLYRLLAAPGGPDMRERLKERGTELAADAAKMGLSAAQKGIESGIKKVAPSPTPAYGDEKGSLVLSEVPWEVMHYISAVGSILGGPKQRSRSKRDPDITNYNTDDASRRMLDSSLNRWRKEEGEPPIPPNTIDWDQALMLMFGQQPLPGISAYDLQNKSLQEIRERLDPDAARVLISKIKLSQDPSGLMGSVRHSE